MKGRESGMPDETWWASFFDVEGALNVLCGAELPSGDVVEFGCGYGTFTVPVARRTTGIVTALDIEEDMIACVRQKSEEPGLHNIHVIQRDFIAEGSGVETGSQSHVMIYNLLHVENPLNLLREARRVLKTGGRLSVMHWRSDISTPRGPSLTIRPRPLQCRKWMTEVGFTNITSVDLQPFCPYHYGLTAIR